MKSLVNSAKILRSVFLRSFAVLAVGLLLPTAPLPANNTWVGGGSSGDFSDVANWASAPSWSYSNSLIFQTNTSASTLLYDISPQVVNDIYFDTLFPAARTLQTEPGGAIYFKTRLENLSAHTQTINMPLLGGYDGANSIQLNPVRGNLVINGDFYNDFNKSYAVFGSETANITSLTLNTGIGLRGSDQANINFTVASGRNIAVQVNTSQIWQGRTELQAGTFTMASGVTLASSDIFINGGNVITTSADTFSNSAKLRVNAGQLSVGASDTIGSLEGTGGSVVISSSAILSVGALNTSTSYAGAITGLGGIAKVGSGVTTLSGTNTHRGATSVNAGQLIVDGSAANSTVTVNSGATLGGSGSVGGLIINSGATVNPGNSPGTLTVAGNATWNAGGNYDWESLAMNTNPNVQTGAGTNWDFMGITGPLTLTGLSVGNEFNLNLTSLANSSTAGQIPGWDPNIGSTWLIASAAGGIYLDASLVSAGTNYSSLFNINTTGWSGGLPTGSFQVVTLGNTTDLYLQAVGSAAVPEPGQIAASLLLLSGIGGYIWMKRRKTAKPAVAVV